MKSRLVLRWMTLLMIVALLVPGKPLLKAAQSRPAFPAVPALSAPGVAEGSEAEEPLPTPDRTRVAEALRSAPVMFIENVGQFADGARFQVRGGMGTMWLAEDAIWITLVEHSPVDPLERLDVQHAKLDREDETRRAVNLKLSFPGANPHPRLEPFDRLDTVVSYFIGSGPDQWYPDVPVWGGVRYIDMYPGVDLEVTSEGGHWTWHFAVRDSQFAISKVRLRVDGADALTLDGNVLRLTTAMGDFTLPLLTVEDATPEGQPATRNPQSSDLLYSTFLGGSDSDEGYAIAVDGAGSAYVTGDTYSPNFPTTEGAFDMNYNGGSWDAFVVKLNASGTGLAYATFLGGDSSDWSYGIAVDGSGAAYVTGWTDSSDFPTTPGAFDRSHGGGYDAFVVKLNTAGSALAYGTFLGGGNGDAVYDMAVDESGAAYITGKTDSSDFPTTPGAFDTSFNGCNPSYYDFCDAFVAKLNTTGSALAYATFLGGDSSEGGYGITVDRNGAAYVTGWTNSSDFPITPGAFDTTHNNDWDAFAVKLNTTGSTLTYATFLGGGGTDYGTSIVVDGSGAAYVTGNTRSSNFPTTPGAFDTSYNGGYYGDTFVVKLNATSSALAYATFLGGASNDNGYGIAVDGSGAAYVTGWTDSSDFPTTPGAFDTTFNGIADAFVVKLNTTGSAPAYATFLGGSSYNEGHSITVEGSGAAYVTGRTDSSDFPITDGAYDTSYNGNSDAFMVKLAVKPTAQNVELVGQIGGDIEAVAVQGNYAYVAAGESGLRVIDISDPSDPYEVGRYNTPRFANDVFVSASHAYMGTDDALRIIDISDPASPYEVGSYEKEHPYGPLFARVVVSGDYAYVLRTAVGAGTLQVLNVSDPHNPYEMSNYDPLGFPEGVFVSGSHAYVTSTDTATWVGSLQVVDVSDPHNPYKIGSYVTPGYPRGVFVSGTYAYMTEDPQLGGSEPRGLRVVDVSDPHNPHGVGFCDTPGDANDVFVSGFYAYVVTWDTETWAGSLRVVDVSEPDDPQEVGYYDMPGYAQDVFVSDSYAYVAAGDEGLLILRFTGGVPTFSISGRVTDGSGNPISGVTVSDGAGHTATTDSNGNYTLSGLVAGTYTITPSKSGHTFSPTSHTVSVPPDATGQDFTGSSVATLPTVTTLPASEPTLTSATLNGTVNPNGSGSSAWFEWGTDPDLSTFSSTPEQAMGAGTAPVTVTTLLTKLQPGTPYYYRAAARNDAGTSRGAIRRLIILLGNNPTWRQNLYWNKYDRLIYTWAHQKNLPAPLLKAVIAHESGGLGSQSSLDRPALAFLYEPVTIDERYATPKIRSDSLPDVRLADYVLPDNPPPPGKEPYNRFWDEFVSIPPGTTNRQMMSKSYPLLYGLTNPYGTPSEEFVAQYRLASSYGLGQVVYWWHHGLIGNDPPETLYDPETAIEVAATVLGRYRDRCAPGLTEATSDFTAWNPVLRAYNSGRCDGAPQYPNFVENYFPHCQPVLAGEDFDPDNLLAPRSLAKLPSAPLTASQAALLPGQGPLDPDEYEVARLVADLKGTGQQQLAILYFVSPPHPTPRRW